MQLITVDSEVFQKIESKLDYIQDILTEKKEKTPLSEKWLDAQDVCQLLNVCNRTLQNYRDRGTLPFSKFGGKMHYRASDIEDYLKKHHKHAFKK